MKMRHFIKTASILLVIALLSALAGCTPSDPDATAQGTVGAQTPTTQPAGSSEPSPPVADEFSYPMQNVKLSINLPEWDPNSIEDYLDTQYYFWNQLQERTGVELEFVGGDAGAYDLGDSCLLLLASMDWPDIFRINWLTFNGGPNAAINDGYIIELNGQEEHFPNFARVLEEREDINRMVRNDDGQLYCFPYIQEEALITTTGLIVRTDWLEELNLAVPETADELANVLTAFRDDKSVTSPMTFESRWLFMENAAGSLSSAFDTTYPFYVQDGQVQFGPITQEFKQYISTLAQWYADGLIDSDMPSATKASVRAALTNGSSGVVINQHSQIMGCITANEENPGYAIAGIPSLSPAKGVEPEFSQYGGAYSGAFAMSVSTQSQKQEDALRFLDYFYSEEGQRFLCFGTEGYSYDLVDGEVVMSDWVYEHDVESVKWQVGWPYNWPMVRVGGLVGLPDVVVEAIDAWRTPKMADHDLGPITQSNTENAYISSKYLDIDTYCKEMIIKFIIGTESMDGWDGFVQTIKDNGIENIIAFKQDAYERYLSR